MKVAFFRGYSAHFLAHVARLSQAGVDFHIYDYHRPPERMTDPLVRAYQINKKTKWMETGPIWGPLRFVSAMAQMPKAAFLEPRGTLQVLTPVEWRHPGRNLRNVFAMHNLYSILKYRDQAYDIIHANYGNICHAVRFTKSIWKGKFLASYHGELPEWLSMYGREFYTQVFDTADGVTAVTKSLATQLLELGCPPEKLTVLPLGVDTSRFEFKQRDALRDNGPMRLITVARLVSEKGIDRAVAAVGRIIDKFPSLRYDILGEGPARNALEHKIATSRLSGRVNLLGHVTHEEVARYLSAAHVFVLPSYSETIGVAVLEAQATGLPVVATAVGGLPEAVVDGKSGLLVAPGDVDALADRLTFLLEHADLWPSFGRAGREHVERHFDISKVASKWLEVYGALLEGRELGQVG